MAREQLQRLRTLITDQPTGKEQCSTSTSLTKTVRHVEVRKRASQVKTSLKLPRPPKQFHNTESEQSSKVSLLGACYGSALLPLLLLKPRLRTVVSSLAVEEKDLLSDSDLVWVKTEFETLLMGAAQEYAASYRISSGNLFRANLLEPEGAKSFAGSRLSLVDGMSDLSPKRYDADKQRKTTLVRRFRYPIGTLEVRFQTLTRTTSCDCNVCEAAFYFKPSIDVHPVAISGIFRRIVNQAEKPTLTRQLTVLNIISDHEFTTRIRDTLRTISIPEIDASLRSGAIVPYQIDSEGRSIHSVRLNLS